MLKRTIRHLPAGLRRPGEGDAVGPGERRLDRLAGAHTAREARRRLGLYEQAQVDHLIRPMENVLFVEDVHKFVVAMPPLILQAFDNGTWQITYRVTDWVFEIYRISRLNS